MARLWQRSLTIGLVVIIMWCLHLGTPPAWAGLQDDRFDGNIFALYAGNGSLVPPKETLSEALKRHQPILLVLYVEDSSDCKAYSSVVSQLQAFYGRAMEFIPINVDALAVKDQYAPDEPGYYYKGVVPQTVIFNQAGDIVLNETGQVAFETTDTVLRQVFDLLPRSESVELRRRQLNEVNTEITQTQGGTP